MVGPVKQSAIDKAAGGTSLERAFDTYWRQVTRASGLPPADPVPQYPFDRWAFDRAWPAARVAIELDGGTQGEPVVCHVCKARVRAVKGDGTLGKELRLGGGHSRGKGAERDRTKDNAATLAGWRVFRFTGAMLAEDPIGALGPIHRLILGLLDGR